MVVLKFLKNMFFSIIKAIDRDVNLIVRTIMFGCMLWFLYASGVKEQIPSGILTFLSYCMLWWLISPFIKRAYRMFKIEKNRREWKKELEDE